MNELYQFQVIRGLPPARLNNKPEIIQMNVVMIVPTGIGCEIGGHCGDGNAPARLLGACCETLVLHPNVVNA